MSRLSVFSADWGIGEQVRLDEWRDRQKSRNMEIMEWCFSLEKKKHFGYAKNMDVRKEYYVSYKPPLWVCAICGGFLPVYLYLCLLFMRQLCWQWYGNRHEISLGRLHKTAKK